MWRFPDPNNDKIFRLLLSGEHTPTIKVVMLDTKYQEVDGGTLFSADRTDQLTNFISDGSIDVDTTRGTRRTAELTLLNPTAEFTPATLDFDPEGPWVGKIYLNRIVRIYRGLMLPGGSPLYAPVGTFMIDQCDVEVQQNMSQVVLTMSDPWKKIQKSFFSSSSYYPSGTPYNDIIRDMLSASGADEPLPPNIDPLHNRVPDDRTTSSKIKWTQGGSRGDFLKTLGQKWDIDMYFDPVGRFVSQDRTDAKDKTVVWEFRWDEDGTGGLISVKRTFNDDNLFNHVVVVGTGNTKHTVRAFQKDTDPRSKTSIDLIGDRVHILASSTISTQAEANKALNRLWKLRFQLSEEVACQTICVPTLEGDDVISIYEPNLAKIDSTYRLVRFNVPLVSSLQNIQVSNIIRQDDL